MRYELSTQVLYYELDIQRPVRAPDLGAGTTNRARSRLLVQSSIPAHRAETLLLTVVLLDLLCPVPYTGGSFLFFSLHEIRFFIFIFLKLISMQNVGLEVGIPRPRVARSSA